MARDKFSLSEARRIALAAQGMTAARSGATPTVRDLRRVLRQIGVLQLDYVNVLVPAHFQVLFARLGPYDRKLLDRLVYKQREFTEQWAHEACFVPMDAWPLLRYRREEHRIRPPFFARFMAENGGYSESVLDIIRTEGARSAESLPQPEGLADKTVSWYSSITRAVLEVLFATGRLAVRERRANLARVYDLPERLIPEEHYSAIVSRSDAVRELVRRAAAAYGIGTAADLADYYRMPPKDANAAIADLSESGEIRSVVVEGWRDPAYIHRDARLPHVAEECRLLSPFDPVVWFRPRASRLFGFDYRIEIYTPESQRKWGYYVLPFLMGETIAGRFDLKADRGVGKLVVKAAYVEPGHEPREVASAAFAELSLEAEWLGLESIVVEPRGNLAAALAHASLNAKRPWHKPPRSARKRS
jgi:uncharacterized protein YcaQ